MSERELRPAGRYEWEQIIRRARLTGLIKGSGRVGSDGRPTKGGVSGLAFKAIALTYATYANGSGCDVRPGDGAVAVDAESTLKVVQAVKRQLIELGLMQLVRRRHGHRADEYRLTLPVDLLDVVEVLTPAQHDLAAKRLYDANRPKAARRDGSAGPPNTAPVMGPPDPVTEPEKPDVMGPPDPTDRPDGPNPDGSAGPYKNGPDGSGGPSLMGPPDRSTYQDLSINNPHPETDLRTDVAVTRARDHPDEDQILGGGKCAPHRLAGGTRPDGQPACPLCRRAAAEDLLRTLNALKGAVTAARPRPGGTHWVDRRGRRVPDPPAAKTA